jgi:hypothetical protein
MAGSVAALSTQCALSGLRLSLSHVVSSCPNESAPPQPSETTTRHYSQLSTKSARSSTFLTCSASLTESLPLDPRERDATRARAPLAEARPAAPAPPNPPPYMGPTGRAAPGCLRATCCVPSWPWQPPARPVAWTTRPPSRASPVPPAPSPSACAAPRPTPAARG